MKETTEPSPLADKVCPAACDEPDALGKTVAPIYRSEELLQGNRELFILHGGEIYRLIRTRNNKLILQK